MPVELPPIPDRQTGQPRPPQGPILKPSNEKPQPFHPKKVPKPPEGAGPPLEWCYGDSRGYRWLFVTTIVLVGAFLTVKDLIDSDESWWFTHWWGWLIVAVCGLIMVLLLGRTQRFSAGADWLMRNKEIIKTYQLTRIKMDKDWSEGTLDLDDSHGNGVIVGLGYLRINEALWDLVYNGIRHSVVNGAQVNRMAVERLHLWNEVAMREQQWYDQQTE